MSVKSRAHLSRVLGDYTNLTCRFLARWDGATDDLLQQRYTPTRLLSDIFGFWADVGTGAELVLELAKGDFPTVRFTVKISDKTAIQTIRLPRTIDAKVALNASSIAPVSGAGTPNIPNTQVVPSRIDDGDGLAVQLTGVDTAKLVEGDYEGQITDGNQQIVAYIVLHATS